MKTALFEDDKPNYASVCFPAPRPFQDTARISAAAPARGPPLPGGDGAHRRRLQAAPKAGGTKLAGRDSFGGTKQEPPKDDDPTLAELGPSKSESTVAGMAARLSMPRRTAPSARREWKSHYPARGKNMLHAMAHVVPSHLMDPKLYSTFAARRGRGPAMCPQKADGHRSACCHAGR